MMCTHGTYSLEVVSDNIVIVDAKGPWNLESAMQYHNDVIKLVTAFNGQGWHHIGILRGETLFGPEVLEFMRNHLLWRKKHNALSDTTVFIDSYSENVSTQQLDNLFESMNMTHFVARDLLQALDGISCFN